MRFTLPRDLHHGKDALEALKTLTGKKAIVAVDGGSMKRFGSLDKIVDYLEEVGMEVKLLEDVKPDPPADAVLRSTTATQEFEPDQIAAVGGGSPIGAARAVWAFYEYPNTSLEDLITPSSFPTLRTKAKFCTTSSTPGTTTEVTAFSVITDYKKDIKYPLADSNITFDVAVVDPALAETMLGKLTVHTGMDTTTHAIEAHVSTLHCEYMDPLVLHAIEMTNEYLIPSYNGDMEARDKVYGARCLAGTTFSNALLGIIHSMAHKTDAAYPNGHIVHGCTNAMCLPEVIKFNSKEPEAAVRYTKIAKFISLSGTIEEELTDALIVRFLETNKAPDIPACIKGYEDGIIGEKEFIDRLPKITKLAVGDARTSSNPRSITPRVMEQLLECCYYDEEVNF